MIEVVICFLVFFSIPTHQQLFFFGGGLQATFTKVLQLSIFKALQSFRETCIFFCSSAREISPHHIPDDFVYFPKNHLLNISLEKRNYSNPSTNIFKDILEHVPGKNPSKEPCKEIPL